MKTSSKIAITAAAVGAWLFGRKNKSVSGIGKANQWGGMVTVTEGTNMLANALRGKTNAKIVFRYQGEKPIEIRWDNRYGRKGYTEINAEFAKYFKPYNFAGADVYYGCAVGVAGSKKFYVYAGYYENYISSEPMPKPYVLDRTFRSIDAAIDYAEGLGDEVIYCENVKDYLPVDLYEILQDNDYEYFEY